MRIRYGVERARNLSDGPPFDNPGTCDVFANGKPSFLPAAADRGPLIRLVASRLLTCRAGFRKPPADAREQRVADLAIGLELLLPVTVGAGRIVRRPIFDVGGERPR